jgi:Bacterial protein of unknown function (HtrL_YibB)
MATIVTAYFKLAQSKASHEKYVNWMQNMLAIDNPMVIFCEKDCVNLIKTFRLSKMDKTHIIVVTFQDFYSYRYGASFTEHYEKDTEKRVGHGILLYLIWSEKSHFLKRAVELDPFKTDYFLWVDIGCFRRPNTEYINWPNPQRIAEIPNDKVLLLSVYPFQDEELACNKKEDLPLFQFTNRIGAPIFGGGKEVLLKWHSLYYDMLEYFISIDRFIGKDQSIMNSVYLLNRDICELVSWKTCADPWFYLQDYLR